MARMFYTNKSKRLKGQIRVSTGTQEWRGFTLHKNYLFGETEQGYFVFRHEFTMQKNLWVYKGTIVRGDIKWRAVLIPRYTSFAQKLIDKMNEVGKVEYEPVEFQKFHRNGLRLNRPYYPLKHMVIPYAGHS